MFIMMDSIDMSTCKDAIEFVLKQSCEKKKQKRLQFLICSEGGDLNAAFALIDVMKASKIPIYTVGLGMVASAGLLIFMSDQKLSDKLIKSDIGILSSFRQTFQISFMKKFIFNPSI